MCVCGYIPMYIYICMYPKCSQASLSSISHLSRTHGVMRHTLQLTSHTYQAFNTRICIPSTDPVCCTPFAHTERNSTSLLVMSHESWVKSPWLRVLNTRICIPSTDPVRWQRFATCIARCLVQTSLRKWTFFQQRPSHCGDVLIVSIHIHMYAHVHIHTCIHIHLYIHIHMYIHTHMPCACMYATHMHARTHIHTRARARTHAQTWNARQQWWFSRTDLSL